MSTTSPSAAALPATSPAGSARPDQPRPRSGRIRLAVDIGGTFTDLAAFDQESQSLSFGKALSTHGALFEAIEGTIDAAGLELSQVELFLHGSTIAINTLLERTGACTALLITEGFRDIYEIGRVNRPDAYNLFFRKHEPLVPRSLRFEVPERQLASGQVLQPLDEEAVRRLARSLKARGVEAVAVLLLHSYRNPDHERRVSEILREELPDAFVSASHELTREYREFERVSTVAANAYVGPRVSAYLDEIEAHLAEQAFAGDFLVVQSTGGLFPVKDARRDCVRMLESGPAAGVIGARALCHRMGLADAIAFDMGGTTAKAGLIRAGEAMTANSALIGGYERALPIQVPMMDIFEVGTGGGSIARAVPGGGIRVGPQSAGSEPGPACYGRGGLAPTVTDANLVLGRLDPENFLGGEMRLDGAAAVRALRQVADPLGLDPVAAAEGIIRIAVTAMSHAVKAVTLERGLDPAAFAMIVYGGAGPLHASAIAREIGIRQVLVPYAPGHFSAYGMLFSDLRYDYVRSVFFRLAEAPFEGLAAIFDEMESLGRGALSAAAVPAREANVSRAADMRYVGQEHAVTVPLTAEMFARADRAAVKRAFDEVHAQRYGTCAPDEAAEIVSLRATVAGLMAQPEPVPIEAGSATPLEGACVRRRPVYFAESGGFTDTPVYDRTALRAGNRFTGPTLVEERASTTVIAPGDVAEVDDYGNLRIEVGGAS